MSENAENKKPKRPFPVTEKPKVVALGGGHGLAQTLTALKEYAGKITAIVSVADNGGSSKVFRDELNMPAIGDMRRCLLALADENDSLTQTMSYRFTEGRFLDHPVGNFVLAGLYQITNSLEAASREFACSLNLLGNVLPACNGNVTLAAITKSGAEVRGQIEITGRSDIARVKLIGADVKAPDAAISSIAEADQIIIGPGSLYTSLLAALLADGIREAFNASPGQKIYIANLHTQNNETRGYSVADHLEALSLHGFECEILLLPPDHHIEHGVIPPHVRSITSDLADKDGLVHAPFLLAQALEQIWRESLS